MPEHGTGEFAVGLHVGHAGFDEKVEAATDHVAFEDFGAYVDGGMEFFEHVRGGAIQQHFDEHEHAGA